VSPDNSKIFTEELQRTQREIEINRPKPANFAASLDVQQPKLSASGGFAPDLHQGLYLWTRWGSAPERRYRLALRARHAPQTFTPNSAYIC